MEIKLYPLAGLKSFKTPTASGAWKLFTLAKNIAGIFDHIKRDDLLELAKSQGIKDVTLNRWMTAARNLGLFTDVQRMSGEWMLILPSNKKLESVFECRLGKPVTLPIELLFKKGWRAYVFASWQAQLTGNGERLISQNKQAELSGIDRQTQKKFNKEAGVISSKNYAISNIHANGYSSVLEFGNRACLFQYWDQATHQKKLGWRIPDSRVFPLYGTDFSHKTPGKMSLFNRTPEQYSATMSTIRRLSSEDKELDTKEIYTFDRQSKKGNNLWIHSAI